MNVRYTARRRARAAVRAGLMLAVALGATVPLTASADLAPAEAPQKAWITGYSYWDNSPPGSADIARPVVHDQAGGTGTWEDPITIAVGHGKGGWHYAPGTRIYLEGLRKYAVVEDLCGACSSGHHGAPHLDLYIGGENSTARQARACAMKITAMQEIVVNPAPDHPVTPGEIADTCATN